jgi:hypothetical protein
MDDGEVRQDGHMLIVEHLVGARGRPAILDTS